MSNPSPKILITGAAGHFGRLVLTHLTDTYHYPASQIIATTRNVEHLAEWREKGVEVRAADFTRPESLPTSFEGAEKLLIISTDSLDNDVRLAMHRNAVEAAKKAGAKHLFYTSMPQPDHSLISFAPVHLQTEHALLSSGLSWTILRNNWYYENLLFTFPAALKSGKIYSAAGGGRIAYISRSDQAQAAAAALVAPSGVVNRTFTLTGSEALDLESVVSIVNRVLDASIQVVHVPVEAIVEGARSHGLPEIVATTFASFDVATKEGNLAVVTGDYQQLVGTSPDPFECWLLNHKQLFQVPQPA